MKIHFLKLFSMIAFLGFIMPLYAQAQDAYVDSLKTFLTEDVHDTVRVNTLIELSKNYLGSDLELALDYTEKAKVLARKSSYKRGLAYAYKYAGIVYYFESQYVECWGEWQKSLTIFDSIQDRRGMANILSNIGAVYFDQGNNDRALENYLQSLQLSQQIGDDLRIATAMINIGAVYFDKPATHNLALEYYLQALEISEKIKYIRAIGTVSLNIGEIYLARGDDKQAEQYFQKSLDYVKGLDIEPSALIGLGAVEKYRKNYKAALAYQRQAFETSSANDDLIDAARSLVAQAEVLAIIGDENEAIKNYKNAIPLAAQWSSYKELKDIYLGLMGVYSSMGRYDSAYKYSELLSNVKDTLSNISSDQRVTVKNIDFEIAKKEAEISRLTSESAFMEALTKRQTVIKIFAVVAFFLLVVLFLLFRRNIFMRKTNAIIDAERLRSEKLLLNILPASVAEELKETGASEARDFENVTVLFTDFKEFTQTAEKLTAKELVGEINTCFKAFDEIVGKYNVEKIKTIGDAYMAAGGLHAQRSSEPKDVLLAALEMQHFMREHKKENEAQGLPAFEMRVGIHTGPVVAGIVGIKKFQYDIWGDTVNTASRMESHGEVGKVNISETTFRLIQDVKGLQFEFRGKLPVKGKGEYGMYFVTEG